MIEASERATGYAISPAQSTDMDLWSKCGVARDFISLMKQPEMCSEWCMRGWTGRRYERYLGMFFQISYLLAVWFIASWAFPTDTWAGTKIPGEDGPGLFYTITHLHPAAYLILFFIFVLSVVNLIYGGHITPRFWPFSKLTSLLRGRGPQRSSSGAVKRAVPRKAVPKRSGIDSQVVAAGKAVAPLKDEVSGPRPMVKKSEQTVSDRPTPLDGLNHPMPQFNPPGVVLSGVPKVEEQDEELQDRAKEFRFTSAVDLPSPEEQERREKEKLVVSGRVKGPDGKILPSVLVFLADHEGNRVGQSCRTNDDTGDFKVQVNEQGRYVLHAYKRGYIIENPDPLVLPSESGRLEGMNFSMIPEGCLVQGRVLLEGSGEKVPGLQVVCINETDGTARSGRSDGSAAFKISGVPHNSRCFVEVRDDEGTLLAATESFETGQRRNIYREIKISAKPKSTKQKDGKPDSGITTGSGHGAAGP
ncbi:carboxypeptidase-like regulatory domain-containing protein [Thermodesulfobacteriota bacterium]